MTILPLLTSVPAPPIGYAAGNETQRPMPALPLPIQYEALTLPSPSISPLTEATYALTASASASASVSTSTSTSASSRGVVRLRSGRNLDLGRKPIDLILRDLFTIVPTESGKGIHINCMSCNVFNREWSKYNATKARAHLVDQCDGVSEELREHLYSRSQKNKRSRMMDTLNLDGDMSLCSETTADIRKAAMKKSKDMIDKNKHQTAITDDKNLGPVMTKTMSDNIIMKEVEAIVSRGESLSRLQDEYVIAALRARCPGIESYLPRDADTTYTNYVTKIDISCSKQLRDHLSRIPGCINVAFDGVTVNGKQKILYTVSKGSTSMFVTWTDLAGDKHVTQKEADDALRVALDIKASLGGAQIASLPVDNAAKLVAGMVANRLDEPALVSRDPSHCVDLLSKDASTTKSILAVLEMAKDLINFLKIDRINGIRETAILEGRIGRGPKVQIFSDTRMNGIHDMLRSTAKQKQFVDVIRTERQFQEYYNERTRSKKDKIDTLLRRCSQHFWDRIDFACRFTGPFKRVHKLLSKETYPLSCYVLLVQALKNEIDSVIQSGETCNNMLGDGADLELGEMVRVRFNMDGKDPSGKKVGLLDEHQLWCFLCDPFGHEWRSEFLLEGFLTAHTKKMIEHFIPGDDAGAISKRASVKKEFMVSGFQQVCFIFIFSLLCLESNLVSFSFSSQAFHTQTLDWAHRFEDQLPPVVPIEEHCVKNKQITVDKVQQWVEKTGTVEHRIQWFVANCQASEFYHLIAKPLLSMRTVGSIDVEREAKTLKHTILTKNRNRTSDGRGVVLMRTCNNLKYLLKMKQSLKMSLK